MNPQTFHFKTLSHFNNIIFKDVLTEDNQFGNEIAIKLDVDDDTRHSGYTLRKGLKTYFMFSSHIKKLPVRALEVDKVLDGKNVYHLVKDYKSVKVTGEDTMTFRELVDSFCPFKHSKPTHFLLWKIITLGAYVSRINFRLATPPAFGKNSCVDSLRELTNNVARVDRATFPKLEFVIRFPLIICNEIASLSGAEQREFESFGLSAGDFSNKYTKRSRKTSGTKEIMDISKLSLGFTYNDRRCYESVGRGGFDSGFPTQFLDRFLPLKMEGALDVNDFAKEGEFDFHQLCKDSIPLYRKMLKKLVWLIESLNPRIIKDADGSLISINDKDPSLYESLKPLFKQEYEFGSGRHEKSFNMIQMFISHYASCENEFVELSNELYLAYNKYLEEEVVVRDEDGVIVEEEVI